MAVFGNLTADVTSSLSWCLSKSDSEFVADPDGQVFCISSILTFRRVMVTHGVITECGKGFHLVHWTDLDSFFATRSTKRMGESTERDSVKFSWPESLFVPFSLFLQPVILNSLPSINNLSVCPSICLENAWIYGLWCWWLLF